MGGDSESELCRKYAARIRGYGLRHLRDPSRAEDLVQHVLVVLLEAVREGRAGETARQGGWVLVTCRNTVMDMRRGEARQRRLAERSAAEALPPYEPDRTPALDRRRLTTCLAGLDPRDRAIVVATFVEDRDADEIGQAMKLSAGNVRVIRHRALARLQACIEGRAS